MAELSDVETRKAKRLARREKQRQQNIVRAAKMHKARLEGNKTSTSNTGKSKKPDALNIGCSGWFYWHWRYCFYPKDSKPSEWFNHYADTFKTVEINASFYSWPTVAGVQAWIKQIGRKKFTYTVKVCELITHVKRFEGTKALIKDFGYVADILGPRMGCFLFQLPPSFHYTPARLKKIVSQLDPARRNVVEFRHRSWWNAKVYDAFRKAGIIFCSCSGPRLPDELIKTADDVYIRFHGTTRWYRHDYTKQELAEWAKRIQDSGAKSAWIYFNNDRECFAIKNARELRKQLTTLSKLR